MTRLTRPRSALARLSAERERPRPRPISLLGLIIAIVLVLDLAVATVVFLDRRDDPLTPDFLRADVSGISWDVDVFRNPAPVLRLSTNVPPPARVRGGHITFPDGFLRPDTNARYALGALSRYDRTRQRFWLTRAQVAVKDVLKTVDDGLIPHDYTTKDIIGVDVDAPWFAADTQGLMLSALSRLATHTSDRRWRVAADDVFEALFAFKDFLVRDRPVPRYWLTSVDDAGFLWFDGFSSDLRTYQILNNQLWTLLGIYDYRRTLAKSASSRRQASRLFAGGLATVEHYLPEFRDPGRLSIDSLVARNHNMAAHFLAVEQMNLLARVTEGPTIARYSKLLDEDDDVPFFPVSGPALETGVRTYEPLPLAIAHQGGRERPQRMTLSGVPTEGEGIIDPTRSAAFALAELEEYRRTSQRQHLRRAEAAVEDVLDSSVRGALPNRFTSRTVFGDRISGTWYSAEGQGLMLSALSHLQAETGEERWSAEAAELAVALTRVDGYGFPPPRPWMAVLDNAGYVWFEQFAGDTPPTQAIMGHLTALIGLYDYWRLTGDRDAYFYFRGGIASLTTQLPALRKKSAPALTTILGGRRRSYNEPMLVQGVETLARITGKKELVRYAMLLKRDYG